VKENKYNNKLSDRTNREWKHSNGFSCYI